MFSSVIGLLSLTGFTFAQQQWTHFDENTWAGKCTVGTQQSPIDFVYSQTRPDPKGVHIRGPLVYRGYDRVKVTARNTGYTIRWAPTRDSPVPTLSGGPLRGNYSFIDVHFHWMSEHAFEGLKYPLEIHMVHVKTGLSVAEAVKQPDGIAVIGIVAEVGVPGSSAVLNDLLPAMQFILEKSGESPVFEINLTRMFSPHPQQYYTYHGSLTTPECAESVVWIVMPNPTLVSHENYKNLTQPHFSGINNDRSVQPIGSRAVYRTSKMASCSHSLSPSLGSWAIFLGCFTTNMSNKFYKSLCVLGNIKRKFLGLIVVDCD